MTHKRKKQAERQPHNPLADLMMRRIKISAVFWSCGGFSKPMLLECGGFGNRRFPPKPVAKTPPLFRAKKTERTLLQRKLGRQTRVQGVSQLHVTEERQRL
jgi:hypothetical protein